MDGPLKHGHTLPGQFQGRQQGGAGQDAPDLRAAQAALRVHNAQIGDGRFAHKAVFVKGHGHVHAFLAGFHGHEDIGQIIGALDAGQIFLLGRNGAAEDREPFAVHVLIGQFRGQGHNVQTGLRAFRRGNAETARPPAEKDAQVAVIPPRGAGHVQNALAQFLPGTGRRDAQSPRAVAHAGQVLVQDENLPLPVADALEQAVAAMADVVVQGQQQKARVRTDASHPVIVKGQKFVRPRPGGGQKGLQIGVGIHGLHDVPLRRGLSS